MDLRFRYLFVPIPNLPFNQVYHELRAIIQITKHSLSFITPFVFNVFILGSIQLLFSKLFPVISRRF